jgi:hypothetical protein
MAMAGADWIAIDACGCNLRPSPPFDRFVDPYDERTCARECRNEQPQEDPARFQTRPNRAVEHAMIALELAQIRQANGTQRRTDHPSSWRENGSDEEHLDMTPHGARK